MSLERIESKIDTLQEHVTSLAVHLAAQQQLLKDHVRRTEVVEKEIAPIRKHVILVNGLMKLVGAIGVYKVVAYLREGNWFNGL